MTYSENMEKTIRQTSKESLFLKVFVNKKAIILNVENLVRKFSLRMAHVILNHLIVHNYLFQSGS